MFYLWLGAGILCAFTLIWSNTAAEDLEDQEFHRRILPVERKISGGRHGSHFTSNLNPVDIEKSILIKEMMRSELAFHMLKHIHGYDHIQGFYHTSKWRTFWKEVISEQLLLLDGKRAVPEQNVNRYTNTIPWDNSRHYTSLLNMSAGLYMNVVGPDKSHMEEVVKYVDTLGLRFRDKIQVNFNRTIGRYNYDSASAEKKKLYDQDSNLSCGEFSTIMTLRNYCIDQVKAGKKTLVYYIQSKGQCCQRNVTKDTPPQNEGVSAWREYMNTMNIEFPSICMRAMMKGYLACGVENQDMHFSGNYWWADCHHVAQLGPLKKRWDFGEPEYFVLRFHEDFGLARQLGFQCGYSIFNCGVNLYDVACSRDRYRERLNKFVHFKIGPNNVKGKNDSLTICKELTTEYIPYKDRGAQLKRWWHSN